MYSVRHYLRLDPATQEALEQLTRYTCCTKSQLMRQFVQQGVQRVAEDCEKQIIQLKETTKNLKRFSY